MGEGRRSEGKLRLKLRKYNGKKTRAGSNLKGHGGNFKDIVLYLKKNRKLLKGFKVEVDDKPVHYSYFICSPHPTKQVRDDEGVHGYGKKYISAITKNTL